MAYMYKTSASGATHFFRNLFPWKSKEELGEYLCRQVFHNTDGVVGIVKPFGVGARNLVQTREDRYEIMRRSGKEVEALDPEFDPLHHCRGTGVSEFTLEDTLPTLRHRLNLPQLSLEKSTDKFTSGVAIFSSDEKISARIRDSIRRNIPNGIQPYSYYIISTNISSSFRSSAPFKERVGIVIAENMDTKISHPIVLREFSRRSVLSGETKPVSVTLSQLDKNPELNVCLSQIDTTSVQRNFLRIYYASLVSPILGDHLYSSRVGLMSGVMTLVPPALVRVGVGQQTLSSAVISALRLRRKEGSIQVPLQAHLHSFTLGNFYGKGKHLRLIAPVTPLFEWTCRHLSLKLRHEDNSTSSH